VSTTLPKGEKKGISEKPCRADVPEKSLRKSKGGGTAN